MHIPTAIASTIATLTATPAFVSTFFPTTFYHRLRSYAPSSPFTGASTDKEELRTVLSQFWDDIDPTYKAPQVWQNDTQVLPLAKTYNGTPAQQDEEEARDDEKEADKDLEEGKSLLKFTFFKKNPLNPSPDKKWFKADIWSKAKIEAKKVEKKWDEKGPDVIKKLESVPEAIENTYDDAVYGFMHSVQRVNQTGADFIQSGYDAINNSYNGLINYLNTTEVKEGIKQGKSVGGEIGNVMVAATSGYREDLKEAKRENITVGSYFKHQNDQIAQWEEQIHNVIKVHAEIVSMGITGVLLAYIILYKLIYQRTALFAVLCIIFLGWVVTRLYVLRLNRDDDSWQSLQDLLSDRAHSAFDMTRVWIYECLVLIHAWLRLFLPLVDDATYTFMHYIVPVVLLHFVEWQEWFFSLPKQTQFLVALSSILCVVAVQAVFMIRNAWREVNTTGCGEASMRVLYQFTFVIVAPVVWVVSGDLLAIHQYWITPFLITGLPFLASLYTLGRVGIYWDKAATDIGSGNYGIVMGNSVQPWPFSNAVPILALGSQPSPRSSGLMMPKEKLPTTENLPRLVTEVGRLNGWLSYWALWPLITLLESLLIETQSQIDAEHTLEQQARESEKYHQEKQVLLQQTASINGQVQQNMIGLPPTKAADLALPIGSIRPGDNLLVKCLLVFVVWVAFYGGAYMSVIFAKVMTFLYNFVSGEVKKSGFSIVSATAEGTRAVTVSAGIQAYQALNSLVEEARSQGGLGHQKSFSAMVTIGAIAVVVIAVSYLALSILELLSFCLTLALWWYYAYDTAQSANEVEETLTEISMIVALSWAEDNDAPRSPRATSSRRLITLVEATIRSKLAFWMTSALWCAVLNLKIPLLGGYLAVATPLVLAVSLVLGAQIGRWFAAIGRPIATGAIWSLFWSLLCCGPSSKALPNDLQQPLVDDSGGRSPRDTGGGLDVGS